MRQLKAYTIPFVGLKEGTHQFTYEIDNKFFDFFEFDEFNEAAIHVNLEFIKKATMLQLNFKISGAVNINCDISNEPFDLPLTNELFLVVKFGESYNDENEELLILPHGEFEINVSQYIYEATVLAIPYKRVHPDVENGSLKSEILNKLEELSPKDKTIENKNDEIDPRWNKLKDLLNNK